MYTTVVLVLLHEWNWRALYKLVLPVGADFELARVEPQIGVNVVAWRRLD